MSNPCHADLRRRAPRLRRVLWAIAVIGGCTSGSVFGGDGKARGARESAEAADAGASNATNGAPASETEPSDDDLSGTADPDPALNDDDAEPPGSISIPPDGSLPSEPEPGGPTQVTRLVHPGVLNSGAELDFIRARIAANEQPWADALQTLQGSTYAADNYQARPFSVVACGSYNSPNQGCTPIVEDGMAVYTRALLWYFTREQRHADKAMQMIDAWARTYEKNTESNARLVVAWAAPWYVNGAEILRYSDAGWSDDAIARFTGMLQKMLPYVQEDTRPENNWIQSRIEAHMAIAVFMDDAAELERAVARFRFWLPIYIYQKSDGSAPVNAPDRSTAQTLSIWKSSASQTSFVDGLAMETCRDLGHLGLGFGSMMYAAETAYQQGIDLFTPNQKRLADFLELHGSWTTGTVKVPSNICGGVVKVSQGDQAGIKPPQGGGSKAWEIAYRHLHDRLSMALPLTEQMIRAGRPTGAGRWVQKWETLTHALALLPVYRARSASAWDQMTISTLPSSP